MQAAGDFPHNAVPITAQQQQRGNSSSHKQLKALGRRNAIRCTGNTGQVRLASPFSGTLQAESQLMSPRAQDLMIPA